MRLRPDVRCSIQAATLQAPIWIQCTAEYVIINDMAFCELCDMDREFCEHGLAERRTHAAAITRHLLISPNGMAHFPGCPHKGDDQDYSRWAELDTPRAWERLGNGEQLQATGGEHPNLIARTRCQDCVGHGPW